MSDSYRAVSWNRQKKRYDLALLLGVLGFLAAFVGVSLATHPNGSAETALIRAFGAGAFLLLHVILVIGPLARLDQRFLPLLYNRRHLGVTMFLMALVHAGVATFTFHALGQTGILENLLSANPRFDSLRHFPFQILGFAALLILFVMAATSHDFWLANLTAPVWKAMHMAVYVAYGLLVAHVALGILQTEGALLYRWVLVAGVVWVVGLHLVAFFKGHGDDRERGRGDDWVDAGPLAQIPDGRARVITVGGERVAVFRYGDQLSAVSSVCQHQNGPLGEGRVIDGLITCPWHGYQYIPKCGRSPAPFDEKIPTFDLELRDGNVFVNARPHPAGSEVEPVSAAGLDCAPPPADGELYVGYLPTTAPAIARFTKRSAAILIALALTLGASFAWLQMPFSSATYEFGVPRTFEGRLEGGPLPTLHVPRPKAGGGSSHYFLVGNTKQGVSAEVEPFDGEWVKLAAALAYRDELTLLELVPDSITRMPESAEELTLPEEVSLGRRRLVGEIVDSKCFLGVMKPGNLKVHRACAVNCISGGIPPLFCVRDREGYATYYFLLSDMGNPINREVLPYVAEPIRITGEVRRQGERLILRTDPTTIERL